MAQTTAAMNSLSTDVEVSADASTWTNISGSLTTFTPDAQQRGIGQRKTIDGDMSIVLSGRKEIVTVTMDGVYTDTTGESFKVLETIWDSTDGTIYVRYFPEGKASGNLVYTSGKGILSSFGHPPIQADSNDPLAFTAVATHPGWTSRTYTTS